MRETDDFPDTFGLPEYRVTKIIRQKVGDDVHMLCGHESFGQIHWLYVAVMKAEECAKESRECEGVALGATDPISTHRGARQGH